jgi:hypothetical protein
MFPSNGSFLYMNSMPSDILLSRTKFASKSEAFEQISIHNSIWQPICLENWAQHAAMMDVLALRPTALAFSESPRGWFRAYILIQYTVHTNWLLSENDISGSMWLLWFRHSLTGVGVGNQQYHAVIEWTHDRTVKAISGLPLRTSPLWEIVYNGGTGIKGTCLVHYPDHLVSPVNPSSNILNAQFRHTQPITLPETELHGSGPSKRITST